MLSRKFKPWHVPLFVAKYAWLTARRMPVLVHFEVTMRCNARCGFCDYWKTPAESKATELDSFADAARFFNPMMITFTGGEPTLRRDLESLVGAVDRAAPLTYITMITHGAMLSEERAWSLWTAGIDQFNISLDYVDGRHDVARGIPGLTRRILDTVPAMRARGIDGIRFNTVIKDDNLDQIVPLVLLARELDVGVNVSVYTDAKNGNGDHVLRAEQHRELDAVIAELVSLKQRHRKLITNTEYYLERIPRWVKGELAEPCHSGLRTIHIDPTGHVKRCPDFPVDFHWTEWRSRERYAPIDCNACFYACRGEAQAPLTLNRARDVLA
jgi:MoaA/NifB/PqqE/SkfB family radical SAM enzyme